jgi:hypothetical protein
MIVLEPTTSVQGFVVTQRLTNLSALPRANKLQITDEETNIARVIDLTGTTAGNYYDTVTITINPALKEGHTYKAVLYYNSIANYTWKGKIFCTAQITTSLGFEDVRDYSVNDGKYIENTTTNQFILND